MSRHDGRILVLAPASGRGALIDEGPLGGLASTLRIGEVSTEEELLGKLDGSPTVVVLVHGPPLVDAVGLLERMRADGMTYPVILIFPDRDRAALAYPKPGGFEELERGQTGRLRELIGRALEMSRGQPVGSALGGVDGRRVLSGSGRDWSFDVVRPMVHELRNSLGTMTNGLEVLLLQSDGPSACRRRTVELMSRQCRQMTAVLDRVMELYRIASGIASLAPMVLTLDDLVEGALAEARESLEDRRVRVMVEVPQGPIWLEVDRSRLIPALGRALTQVILWIPVGECLSVRGLAGPGSVRLEFEMAAGREQAVRAPGAEGMARESKPGGGRGDKVDLSIALARCMVEQHGGELKWGSGTLGVELPRLRNVPNESSREKGDLVLLDSDGERGRSLAHLLQKARYQIRLSTTVQQAAHLVAERPPDAVLIELDDGGGQLGPLLGWMHTVRSASRARIIGLGNADDLHVPGMLFDEVLSKPIQLGALERALRG